MPCPLRRVRPALCAVAVAAMFRAAAASAMEASATSTPTPTPTPTSTSTSTSTSTATATPTSTSTTTTTTTTTSTSTSTATPTAPRPPPLDLDALLTAAYAAPPSRRFSADEPRVIAAVAAEPPGVTGVALVLAALAAPEAPIRFEVVAVGPDERGVLARRGALEVLSAPPPEGGRPLLELAPDPAIGPGVLRARAGLQIPGGATVERLAIVRAAAAGRPGELLAPPPATAWPPGDPRESVTRELTVLPTRSGGLADLLVRTRSALCPGDRPCLAGEEATSWRFDGQRYQPRPYAVPFVERAAASSELASPGALESHAAGAAVDGVLRTAWCEGVPGPGAFQKLTLDLVPAQVLAAVRVTLGDVPDLTPRRPSRLRVVLPDGRRVEAPLADVAGPQRIPLPRAGRVDHLELVIAAVHPGPGEHTCVAEVELETEN